MAIHKLANGPLTLTVVKAESQEGQFGTQVCFDGEGDVRVYVNELTAMKQLARLNLTLDSVVGQTLHMEQIKKDGKTYTNITLANAGAPATPASSAPRAAMPAPAPKATLAEIAAIYDECVSRAMVTLGARCEEAGIPFDASAIQAAAATLFIRGTR
jgi:hypothetical protein